MASMPVCEDDWWYEDLGLSMLILSMQPDSHPPGSTGTLIGRHDHSPT